jgi:hypothetical protein
MTLLLSKTTRHPEVPHQLHQLLQLSQLLRRHQRLLLNQLQPNNLLLLSNQSCQLHQEAEFLLALSPNQLQTSTASTWLNSQALVQTAASSKPTSKKLFLAHKHLQQQP